MLLRQYNPSSLSANLSYGGYFPPPLHPKSPTLSFLPHRTNTFNVKQNSPSSIITCSISQVHSYGTVDYEEPPSVYWVDIYKKISMMENPELGPATVLYQFNAKRKKPNKWELCRVIKELRKYKRYRQALEVYEWMNNEGDRFRLTSSDAAIQLDLISKVHGVPAAEHFFTNLPKPLKDRRIYTALLNAYTHAKMKTKAESHFSHMKEKGYSSHSLSFNVMMTLYINLKEYEKVDALVYEMMEKNIQRDLYSYNIWFSSYGYRGAPELMESAFERMKLDKTIVPNWSTFSTMATMYIKMGLVEKADECLKKLESRITGRDRIPYHYLMSLYSSIKYKDEVYRIWDKYKLTFPNIPNLGYRSVISALIRAGDTEGAGKIYEEWLPVKTSFDPRIVNVLMTGYVKEGKFEKAEDTFKYMVKEGGKPISSTWEILAEGHLAERRIVEALSCYEKALSLDETKKWKPRPVIVSAFFDLCKQEGQIELKEKLVGLLTQSGLLKDQYYADIGLSDLSSDDDVSEQSNEFVQEF